MRKLQMIIKAFFCGLLLTGLLFAANTVLAFSKGIYLTQSSAEMAGKMDYYIKEAKASGIDTFIIDTNYKNTRYEKNIAKVRQAGIRYIARIVVFPTGGTPQQVKSKEYWEKRWNQIAYALSLGANEIQLDYIRYKSSNTKSLKNAHDVHEVIKFFKKRLSERGIKMQIDVFGEAAHRPSDHIGHNVVLFANSVDAICPMVYPSHYEPYLRYSERPYHTVYDSVTALRKNISNHPDVKVYAFIEMSNYRYRMSAKKRADYIRAEIKAAIDAGADGWFAWSAGNKYQQLFSILQQNRKSS
jgi:hypothetical protein